MRDILGEEAAPKEESSTAVDGVRRQDRQAEPADHLYVSADSMATSSPTAGSIAEN